MAIEARHFGQRQETNKVSLFAQLTIGLKSLLNEGTGKRRDHRHDTVAVYLGIALAHELQYGQMTKEQVDQKCEELEKAGLPIKKAVSTYHYFTAREMTIGWFDVNFQLKTLERYLPEVLERSNQKNPPTSG